MSRPRSSRFFVFAFALIGLNLLAWVWVRQSLLEERQDLRIVDVFPLDELDDSTYVSLVFNRDLVTEAELCRPLDDPPFVVQPAVDGYWEWVSPRQLSLQLESPLPAGRVFELRPKRNAAQQFGEQLTGKQTFVLKTRALALEDLRVTRCDNDHAILRFEFNQTVDPAALERHLQIRTGLQTEEIELRALTPQPKDVIEFELRRRELSDLLTIHLSGDLVGVGGVLPLTQAIDRNVRLPKKFAVDHRTCNTPRLGEPVRATISFTETLDRTQSLRDVEVDPPVPGLERTLRYDDLRLRGRFEPGRRYTVTLPPGFRSKRGTSLGQSERVTLIVPEHAPQIHFPHANGILSPHGNRSLEVSAVGCRELEFEMWRVHPNNLLAHLRYDRHRNTSRALAQQHVQLPAGDAAQSVVLDLERLVGEEPGIYHLEAKANDKSWVSEGALVRITDLGLTYRQGKNADLVWVTSLRSGQPLPHVEVAAYSLNNQVLAFGQTDARGLLRIQKAQDHPDGRTFAITARRGNDLNYIRADSKTRSFAQDSADTRAYPSPYEALVYGERGIYRPGDTLHVTAILRDGDGRVPPKFPVELRVYRPDGELVERITASPGSNAETEGRADLSPAGASIDPETEGVAVPATALVTDSGTTGELMDPTTTLTTESTDALSSKATSSENGSSGIGVEQGISQFSVPLSPSAATGRYRLEIGLPGSSTIWGQQTVLVEAFQPVRLEVEAKGDPLVEFGAPLQVSANARYLFGTPAAGVDARVVTRWIPRVFESAQFPRFRFKPVRGASSHTWSSRREAPQTFALDEQGSATIDVREPVELQSGLFRVVTSVTVTPAATRPVSDSFDTRIDRQGRFLGVAPPRAARVNQPAELDWIQRTVHDEPAAPGPITMNLVRIVSNHVLRRVNGRSVWKLDVQEFPVASERLDPTQSQGTWAQVPEESGQYRLRALDETSKVTTELFFRVRGEWDESYAESVRHPERLEWELDETTVQAGQPVTLSLTTPFAGQLLLSIDTTEVEHVEVRSVIEGRQSMTIEIPAGIRGGAFLNATLVRPVSPDDSNWKPHRAYGSQRLRIDHSNAEIPLIVRVPEETRPGDTLIIEVVAETIATRSPSSADSLSNLGSPPDPDPLSSRAWIHVWAVDEGLLLPTRYSVPSPGPFFLSERDRATFGSDVFGNLLPDHQRPGELTYIGGGGAEALERRRRSPDQMRHREPAVVWRNAHPLPADGKLHLEIATPERAGSLRVMAVVVNQDQYGSSETRALLRSPVTVEVNSPRIVAPEDQFEVTVAVFNHTDEHCEDIEIQLVESPVAESSEGAKAGRARFEVIGAMTQRVRVDSQSETTIAFSVVARGAGPVSLRAEARSLSRDGLSGHSTFEAAVRRITPLGREFELTTIPAGTSKTWTTDAEAWVPDHVNTTLRIHARQELDLVPMVDQLIRYPYGCVEQTSSRLLALSCAPSWASAMGLSRGAIDQKIREGLWRLYDLQRPNGGLSYWPGGEATAWGTSYAGHVVAQLIRSGVSVEPRFVEKLGRYLERALMNRDIEEPDREALVLRTLGALGKPQLGRLERLTETVESLDVVGRVHLAVAWFDAGHRNRAESALAQIRSKNGEHPFMHIPVTASGRLTSPKSGLAHWIEALTIIQPQGIQPTPTIVSTEASNSPSVSEGDSGRVDDTEKLDARLLLAVEQLVRARKNGALGNTLENATAVRALCSYYSRNPSSPRYRGTITDGIREVAFDHDKPLRFTTKSPTVSLASQPLDGEGEGNLYFVALREGLRAKPPAPHDRGIEVRRTYRTPEGEPIDLEQVRLGDLLYAEITLRAKSGRHRNIAVVDLLPGGLEAENPRLATSELASSVTNSVDHVEFLDDRVVSFTTATSGGTVIRYPVRAVATGTFQVPGVEASSMYDPQLASLAPSTRIRIQPRIEGNPK